MRGLSRIAGLEEVDVFVSDRGLDPERARRDRRARRAARDRADRARRDGAERREHLDPRRPADATSSTGAPHVRRRLAPGPAEPAGGRLPVLPGRARGARAYDVRWFAEPLAGDAGRALRGRALHAAARRDVLVARHGGRAQGDRSLGRAKRGARRAATTSTTCSSSRTAAPQVGATITHPHGQIYAFDFVPELPRRELGRGDPARRAGRPPGRRVAPAGRRGCPRRRSSRTRCGSRPTSPCPICRRSTTTGRDGLAALLVDVLERLRPAVRRRDAVHALDPPAAVRRRATGPARGCTSRSSRRGARRECRATSRPASSAPASTSTRSRPRRPRRRCATRSEHARDRASSRCSTSAAARRWVLPELASLNRLPPTADARRAAPRACATLDGALGVPARARGPRTRRGALAAQRGWTTVEVPGLWTMQGFGKPQYTNVVMPFDELPPDVPEQNETGHLPALVHASRAAGARGPVVLHFGGVRGRALRARERRSRSGSPRTRARRPSSTSRELVRHDAAERARRGRACAGRTRASSRTRTSGGTPACSRSIQLVLADAFATSSARARQRDGAFRSTPTPTAMSACSTRAGVSSSRAARRRPLRAAGARAAAVVGRAAERSTRSRSSADGETVSMSTSASAASRCATGSCSSTAEPVLIAGRQPPRARRHARPRAHARRRWRRTSG